MSCSWWVELFVPTSTSHGILETNPIMSKIPAARELITCLRVNIFMVVCCLLCDVVIGVVRLLKSIRVIKGRIYDYDSTPDTS